VALQVVAQALAGTQQVGGFGGNSGVAPLLWTGQRYAVVASS